MVHNFKVRGTEERKNRYTLKQRFFFQKHNYSLFSYTKKEKSDGSDRTLALLQSVSSSDWYSLSMFFIFYSFCPREYSAVLLQKCTTYGRCEKQFMAKFIQTQFIKFCLFIVSELVLFYEKKNNRNVQYNFYNSKFI